MKYNISEYIKYFTKLSRLYPFIWLNVSNSLKTDTKTCSLFFLKLRWQLLLRYFNLYQLVLYLSIYLSILILLELESSHNDWAVISQLIPRILVCCISILLVTWNYLGLLLKMKHHKPGGFLEAKSPTFSEKSQHFQTFCCRVRTQSLEALQ